MSDYTQIFDTSASPPNLIGQTTLSAIRAGIPSGNGPFFNAISGNWYPSNSIFCGLNTVGTAGTSTATGTLWFTPFFVTKSTTYTDIGMLVGTVAAGTFVLGIYNDSGNGAPTGSPVTNSNSTNITASTTTFGSYTFSSPIILAAGIYWLGFSSSATTNFIALQGQSTGRNIGGRGLGIPNSELGAAGNFQGGWSQTFTYSSTLPAVGSLTSKLHNTSASCIVFLKAQ